MIHVDTESFFVIVLAAALAAVLVAVVPGRFVAPVVVVEIALGILIGPQVFDIARADGFIAFFANLGLGMLFFFAGYEIEFVRIRGRSLRLGSGGWAISILLALAIAAVLEAAGEIDSSLYVGTAMATTAIGTLIPILHDQGEVRTRFSTYLLGAGCAGAFGPIVLVTIFLSTDHPIHEALILLAFVAVAVAVALVSTGMALRHWPALERTIEASSQLAVRVTVVLVFGLVLLADQIGLDVLVGGFVAGLITRAALRKHEIHVFESKLAAVGFGFFVPFFFVTSGIAFDLDGLGQAGALAKLALFFVLFLVVRGAPALLLYRGVLDRRDRVALAFYSATQLPLVVAITTIALAAGHMRSSTAAALVGAGMLSTLAFPVLGGALRGDRLRAAGA